MEQRKVLGIFCHGKIVMELSPRVTAPVAVMELMATLYEGALANTLMPEHYVAWDYCR
jgi:hypothetical protein